jgi:hypothetical protein
MMTPPTTLRIRLTALRDDLLRQAYPWPAHRITVLLRHDDDELLEAAIELRATSREGLAKRLARALSEESEEENT